MKTIKEDIESRREIEADETRREYAECLMEAAIDKVAMAKAASLKANIVYADASKELMTLEATPLEDLEVPEVTINWTTPNWHGGAMHRYWFDEASTIKLRAKP